MSYNQSEMSEPFESYYDDLTQSDLEPKIKTATGKLASAIENGWGMDNPMWLLAMSKLVL